MIWPFNTRAASLMFVKRFALSFIFALLAMAGDPGASFEAIHHEGERCLICENAKRPAAKMSATRNTSPLKEIAVGRQTIREELVKKITSYSSLCLCDIPPAARFRILLI
jgi:hypothetical protein